MLGPILGKAEEQPDKGVQNYDGHRLRRVRNVSPWRRLESVGDKIRRKKFRGDGRKTIFTQTVVGVWNTLPGRVVKAETFTTFKKSLEEHANWMSVDRLINWQGYDWAYFYAV